MSNTRFNYDDARIIKSLQQSTGSGRYILNTPGPGNNTCFIDDPQMRMQKWGANLRSVMNGHPIDIDSDLKNYTRKLTKYCTSEEFPNKNVVNSYPNHYPTCSATMTEQSRTTHPAWSYRNPERKINTDELLNDPQENVALHFHNNINTRLLERDNFKPRFPCPRNN
tara:strand:+ start:1422 stop:1922 length:501 start_codon:yes stop_codon:yes gene_type:complete